MRKLITTALELGWTLWAHDGDIQPADDPAELLTQEFTNWREREQAQNLCQILAATPAQPLLVWSGNGHATKEAVASMPSCEKNAPSVRSRHSVTRTRGPRRGLGR